MIFANFKNNKSGMALLNVLVIASVGIMVTVALLGWTINIFRSSKIIVAREQAFHIAEAGIDYYRWHLAHWPTDYQNGTGVNGPYVLPFYDKNNNRIGEFELSITPPIIGSTRVVIESTGRLDDYPYLERVIRTEMAIPSFAKYAVVANDKMRFGEGTEVYGPMHSNDGIRFDGYAYNVVSSAAETYDDPDHGGGLEFGVHTHDAPADPLPPASVPSRTDIFAAGREFPVPQVDFNGITSDLADLKVSAQEDGLYFASSGKYGYELTFNTNDTFTLRTVTSLQSAQKNCNGLGEDDWGVWSVNKTSSVGTYSMPSNGIIFIEDNVWVKGQINGARVTLAVGRFPDTPSQRRSIIINSDLTYTNYDGTDVIGLIAQQDISVGLYSENDLRIDAALFAQKGRVGRFYYNSSCGSNRYRSMITLFGMIGTANRYGFAYTDGTGYDSRVLIYDANLLYGPPPSFPLTAEFYETLSWQEIVQ